MILSTCGPSIGFSAGLSPANFWFPDYRHYLRHLPVASPHALRHAHQRHCGHYQHHSCLWAFLWRLPPLLSFCSPTLGKCLIFIVFVIILQQVDDNIIGPKILGDSTGLSAFWVLFALLLFNHLMGFWGMLLGVPLFASFYYLLREFINARLRKKSLPLETQEYVHVSGIDEKGSISYLPPPVIEFHPLFRGEDSLVGPASAAPAPPPLPVPGFPPRQSPRSVSPVILICFLGGDFLCVTDSVSGWLSAAFWPPS